MLKKQKKGAEVRFVDKKHKTTKKSIQNCYCDQVLHNRGEFFKVSNRGDKKAVSGDAHADKAAAVQLKC